MSSRAGSTRPRRDPPDPAGDGDELAYTLLEEARLRCEQLVAEAGTRSERMVLGWIHRELGMAGWLVSSQLVPDRRLARLADAHHRSDRAISAVDRPGTLAEVVICGEDAVAEQLVHGDLSDDLQRTHRHLLRAIDMLDAHLQATGT